MTLKVQHVAREHIHQVWPLVEHWLLPVFEKSDASKYYDIEHLKYLCLIGEQVLIVGSDEEGVIHGAVAIQWLNFPKARVAYITAIGGRLLASKENHAEFISWVRAHGGTRIEGSANEAVARLWKQKLGYSPRQITVELEI
jgi:hypothetical protein